MGATIDTSAICTPADGNSYSGNDACMLDDETLDNIVEHPYESDEYVCKATPSLIKTSDGLNALAYFQTNLKTGHYEPSAVFELGTSYSLEDNLARLPAYIHPQVMMLRSMPNIKMPELFFYVTQTVAPNGQSIPQFNFFMRSSANGSTPSMPGAAHGPSCETAPPPKAPSSGALTVQLGGAVVAIIAFDKLLIQPLIDNDILPKGLRGPALFASLYLSNLALSKAGLTKAAGLKQGLKMAPQFMGFQVMFMMLLDAVGVKAGTDANTYGSITLGLMPYYLASQSPTIAAALETRIGAGIASESASLGVRSLGLAARGLSTLASILGGILLFDLAAEGVVWLSEEMTGDDDLRRVKKLYNLADKRITSGAVGKWPGALAGNILSSGYSWVRVFSSSENSKYERRREEEVNTIVGKSNIFGNAMEKTLLRIVANNTKIFEDGSRKTDWDNVRRDIRSFYRDPENREVIKSHYGLLRDYTGTHAYGPETFRLTINLDGDVRKMDRLMGHLWFRAYQRIEQLNKQMYQDGIRLGFAVRGEHGVAMRDLTAAGELTPAQETYLKGRGLAQTMELTMLMQILVPLREYGE